LVVDAMIGQEAANVAREFNSQLEVTGVILTKIDGDTRGGAALSVRQITGKPIKFTGTGEKITDIETFHPDRKKPLRNTMRKNRLKWLKRCGKTPLISMTSLISWIRYKAWDLWKTCSS